MGSRVVEAEYEKGMLKPSTPLRLRPGERVHLIVMRQPDPKRWDLSRLAESPAADEAVLAEQGLEGWAANLDAEDRRCSAASRRGKPSRIAGTASASATSVRIQAVVIRRSLRFWEAAIARAWTLSSNRKRAGK
jgi:predicted DNA-binding antitoxin AbrB/MazE fold protein